MTVRLRYVLHETKLTQRMLDTLADGYQKPAHLVEAPWIRRVGMDDVPWLLSLAYKRYGAFDPGWVLLRLAEAMSRKHDWLVARSARAFVIANLFLPPWRECQPECNIVVLCAEPGAVWDAVRVARYSVEWAKEKGCLHWWLGSETSYDISPIAKRIGASQAMPRFRMDF